MSIKIIVVLISTFWLFSCEQMSGMDWISSSNLPSIPFHFGEGPMAINQNDCKTKKVSNIQEALMNKAKQIEIFSRKKGIYPDKISLISGKPYILRLYNSTNTTWAFKAEDFFKKAAILKIIYEGKDATIACIESIRIGKLKWAEVHIIPFKKGIFNFFLYYFFVP